VRIVEVFPELSTAEVVDLIRGVTMESLDMEARQGLIRTQPLPLEQEMVIQQKMMAEQSGLMAPPGRMNPDGVIGQLTPEVRVGFGNRAGLSETDKTYKLIDPTLTFSNKTGAFVNEIPDSAFTAIANTGLRCCGRFDARNCRAQPGCVCGHNTATVEALCAPRQFDPLWQCR